MPENNALLIEVVKSVAAIAVEVKGLRKDVDRIESKNDEAVERTSESRRRMYDQIDEVGQRVAKVEGTITSIKDGLEEVGTRIDKQVMPTVNKVQIWEQRGIGVLATVGIVSTTFGAAATTMIYFYWEKVMRFLNNL